MNFLRYKAEERKNDKASHTQAEYINNQQCKAPKTLEFFSSARARDS